MLTGKRVLNVFLGMDDNIFRLRKDWKLFPNGVVDIHSMFSIWKDSNMMDVYQQCIPAVKKRLMSRGKDASNEECELYLQQLESPRLEFFLETFFPGEEIPRSQLAKFADFRHRPINFELITHLAAESFMRLKIFFVLYSKVCRVQKLLIIVLGTFRYLI